MSDEHRETYTASPCPCGHRACKDWHVNWVAARQGVRFTEEQARAVARLLNLMERRTDPRFANVAEAVTRLLAEVAV